jgi:hypothetical protein
LKLSDIVCFLLFVRERDSTDVLFGLVLGVVLGKVG